MGAMPVTGDPYPAAGRRPPVSVFHVVFEWPAVTKIRAETRRIEAAGPEAAKAEAARLHASVAFEFGLPTRYFVLTAGGGRVFTYPDDG